MSYKIVIIGAGIAGLVTGILLKQQGFDVTIYEKQTTIKPIGGGLGIWPNGVRVLMNLSCADQLSQLTANISSDTFSDALGNTLLDVPRDLFLKINGYPIMNVCRSELHQILVNGFGINNIKWGVKCIDIQQMASKAVVYFDNHQEVTADLIIGADGVHSRVRTILFPEKELNYSGYIQFLGVLKYQSIPHKLHNFIIGKNRYGIQFPISRNRHIFYLVLPYEYGHINHLTTRQQRINLFRGWSKEVDILLNAYEDSLFQAEFNHHFYCEESYTMPQMPKWHNNRVVLIGDAAHPIGSLLGLGVGCALEDSDTLTSNLQRFHFAEAISHYEHKQIPRMDRFYQLEKDLTNFIVYANDDEYQHYISEFKWKSPAVANGELINCLR